MTYPHVLTFHALLHLQILHDLPLYVLFPLLILHDLPSTFSSS
jgi:hypothetical protein